MASWISCGAVRHFMERALEDIEFGNVGTKRGVDTPDLCIVHDGTTVGCVCMCPLLGSGATFAWDGGAGTCSLKRV